MIFLVSLVIWIQGCSADEVPIQKGPDFVLTDISGKKASLSHYNGQVVILDFWATWCPPCRMVIPELVKLQQKYRDKGVVVLGISLDDPHTVKDTDLRTFKKNFTINYRILRYNNDVIRKYFGYETPAIPTLFLIDRQGNVKEKIVGYRPGKLEKSVLSVLG
jgi:thiol-disulfide isomerase/thioredoxin